MEYNQSNNSGDYYYKTAAVSVLKTSSKTFDSLGIEPDIIEDNPHRRKGKAYLYSRSKVMEAARRLDRTAVYARLEEEEARSRGGLELAASCPPPASNAAAEEDDDSLFGELF